MNLNIPSPLEQLNSKLLDEAGIEVWVKRDDLIHEDISGNKWRKLIRNVEQARSGGFKKILTFGGAYSNHIAAVGALAKFTEIEIHAMIRGEELNENSNHTLHIAFQNGLKLHFVDRGSYLKYKRVNSGVEISEEWNDCYLIPEGGANEAGVKGCEDIVRELDQRFDAIVLSAGTGATAAGILRKLESTKLFVYPALKGAEFLKEDILSWQNDKALKSQQLELIQDYHFGGFAKVSKELIRFAHEVQNEYDLPLDYLYTAKAFYGLLESIRSGKITKGSKILFYHSGGLQGNSSFEL